MILPQRTCALTAPMCLATLVWLAAAGAAASAVGPDPAATGYVHETFGLKDGFPAAGILEVLQARTGYLWLATFDGLVRFDGVRFEIFDGETIPALASNRIVDLLEDRAGTLWILSEQGHLARLTGGRFTACGAAADAPAACDLPEAGPAAYSRLYEDGEGRVWVGGHAGLYRVVANRLVRVESFPEASRVRALRVDRSDRLWVGTDRGLWWGDAGDPDRGDFTAVTMPSEGETAVATLAEEADGTIWAGLHADSVGRVRDGRFVPVIDEGGSVVAGPGGAIWIGLVGRLLRYRDGDLETVFADRPGFFRLLPGRHVAVDARGDVWVAWSQVLLRNGEPVLRLPHDNVWMSSLTIDRAGTLWVTSTDSGELHAYHPARVDTLAEGLPSPSVYPVYEDRDGRIWVGDRFLAVLEPGVDRFRVVDPPAPPPRRIRAILRDRSGALWVGTGRGLYRRGGGRRDEGDYGGPPGPDRLHSLNVLALAEAAGGGLWVGTDGGLFHRAPSGRWTAFGPDDGLPFPKVRVIREMADGTLWLGTDGGGLARFADGSFTAVDRDRGLSSDLIRAIWPAPDGRLWIATENRGLNRLDPATLDRPGGPDIAVVGRTEGLHANGIHQIVDDGLGNLWMSSNRGIFRVRLADLDAVADGRRDRLDSVVYTERDGMLDREANGGVQQAGLSDREGRIWFPTQTGVVRIDPRRALRTIDPPPVHVEQLRVGDDKPSRVEGAVHLAPTRPRSFSIRFSAPSFQAPGRLRFRYRLTPYERDWVDAGSRREAFYTRVPPGRYRFEVAVLSDGAWSEPAAALDVTIAPRFYETGWFLLACLLPIGAAGFGVVRWRNVRQRTRQRELDRQVEERTARLAEQAEALRRMDDLKSQFFTNLSHEFRTPLTLILGPLHDAAAGAFGPVPGPLAEQIAVAEQNAQRLLTLVDQLLDLARFEAGGLMLSPRRCDLAAHLRQRVAAFQPLAERRRIVLTAELPSRPVELLCDPVEMEKVFDNLLSNALKFTPAGGSVAVELDAPRGSERVAVRVRDDGPGIPRDQLERIFDRFHQVASREHARRGAGLGLALARQIVELHGGTIAATSAAGEGACFTVRLEREPEELAVQAEPGLPTGPLPTDRPPSPMTPVSPIRLPDAADEDRTTVLVVDDHRDVRAYLRRHLEPAYRVLEAADGREALHTARRELPDLVVADVMMPGLDGNELLERLRSDPELELIPIVLVTAKGASADRLEALREGADDYLVKPFDPRELRARVDNLIALRQRLRERVGAPRGLEVSTIEATPADQAFLQRVQSVIERRLDDSDLTVEALAATLGCDRSHLLRRLRALVDETPSGLIRSLRLQRAAQLLSAGAGAVNEVAYAVGFKSVAHFSNAFLDRYGERPSAFAARHRAD